jgi:stage III sporulation protein AB
MLVCGWFGFAMVLSHKREEAGLNGLICALDYFQCELQYRLTPLPDLCYQIAHTRKDMVGQIFGKLAEKLESGENADVSNCLRQIRRESSDLTPAVSNALELLGSTLGCFDLPGQISGIEAVRAHCRRELDALQKDRAERLRSYQTLGLCAGAALVIIFI